MEELNGILFILSIHLVSKPAISHRDGSLPFRSLAVPARLVPEMSKDLSLINDVTNFSMNLVGFLNCALDSLH